MDAVVVRGQVKESKVLAKASWSEVVPGQSNIWSREMGRIPNRLARRWWGRHLRIIVLLVYSIKNVMLHFQPHSPSLSREVKGFGICT